MKKQSQNTVEVLDVNSTDVVIKCPQCAGKIKLQRIELGKPEETVFDILPGGTVWPMVVCMNQIQKGGYCHFERVVRIDGYLD